MGSASVDPDDGGHPGSFAAPQDQHEAYPATPGRIHPADVAEFTAFYRESVPRLVAFLRWQGAPVPDARDCVQETMIEAFQQWLTLRNPYAWCRLVAARRYTRRLAAVLEDPVAEIEPPGVALAADAELESLERRHAVLRALDQLPSRQRQVMAWTYDGATPTEIADALKITPAAVRANLYKARAALRAYLDDTGGELR